MPIRGRSLAHAVRIFVDHLNTVLHSTVTQTPLSFEVVPSQNRANIRFRAHGNSTTAVLATRFGRMGLYIGQVCGAPRDADDTYILRTISYRYALYRDGIDEPILRWEYVRFPGANAQYCRHHIQGPIAVPLADAPDRHPSLNDWHLPTGWVTIEEVLRFCIVDLGVRPLSPNWDSILRESYERFKTEFSPLGEA